MRLGFQSLAVFSALSLLPVGLAYAQTSAPAQPLPVATVPAPPAATARPVVAPQPAQPQPSVEAQPAPLQIVLPPPVWTPADAHQLLAAIHAVSAEGLDPADYDPAGLAQAIATGHPAVFSPAATERFNLLSSDLALGHVRGDDRQDWLIPDPDLDDGRQDRLLRAALIQRRVGDTLRGLLPTHPQYASLREALAATPVTEVDEINRIRLNMDRWRWLPRDLGSRYILVNVPAYTAALVEDGVTKSRHRAVAGAVKTPTPQLQATATGVIFNPWWEVPKSIEPEVRGKPGYVPVRNDAGKIFRWRQPPGPANALGRVKFVMYNPEAIYLHDTNARGLFDTQSRAYSHGCIRTEGVIDLATILLTEGGDEWTEDRIKAALDSKKTVQANFAEPLPVYIVYFSSAALGDGKVKHYTDIYKRDGTVIEALLDTPRPQGSPSRQVAAR